MSVKNPRDYNTDEIRQTDRTAAGNQPDYTPVAPAGDGVTQIIAGTNVTITSTGPSGTGVVTVNASAGSGGITALTGDVTATGPGSVAATIAANAVTNAKAAQMAADTIKGNNTGGTANQSDLTETQVAAMLASFFDAAGAAAAAQTAAEAAFTGDVSKAAGSFATTVTGIHGAGIPSNAQLLSNTSSQLIAQGGTFNVWAYGAVGDGSTSDNTAFVNALAAAVTWSNTTNKRFTLRIPAGTYRLTSKLAATLAASAGFAIEGDGAGATVLRWDSAAAGNSGIALTLNASQAGLPSASPFTIRGFSMTTQAAGVDNGLTITGLPDSLYTQGPMNIVENVSFPGDSSGGKFNIGLVANNPQWVIFRGIITDSNAGIQLNITSTQSLDGIWIDQCYLLALTSYPLDFESTGTGFQSVWITDSLLLANGATGDCIHVNMGTSTGGAGDWVIRDNYFLTRGSGSYCISVNTSFAGNIWIHDNDFDYYAGFGGDIYLAGGERHNIHDNFFTGGGGAEIAVYIANGGTVSGCKIHDNEFSNFAHDITVGANGSDVWTHHNAFTNGGSTNYSRAPVLSDAGFRNTYEDIAVAVAALPAVANAPVGKRLMVNNSNATLAAGIGAVVAGGGANVVPVVNDGTNWRIG